MVFDADDGVAGGPRNGGGEDEAVAVVEEGGVEDGVEGCDEGLVGGDRTDGRTGGVCDENERGGRVGYVVGFWSLEGALGVSVCFGTWKRCEKDDGVVLFLCGVDSCVAERGCEEGREVGLGIGCCQS